MVQETLQAAVDRVGNAVDLMRNMAATAYSHGWVQAQFTDWQSEARAWHDTCALLDQSHHMTDLYISGPGARSMFASLGVNSFATFQPGKAKQFVAVNHDGLYIGDAILFYLEENLFNLVGRRTTLDWVQFNAETGDWDVSVERVVNSAQRRGLPPRVFRYEVQGPNALALMERLTGGPLPDIKFFHLGVLEFAGHRVRVLRHGMAGQAGFELFGPWEEGAAVEEAILAVGDEFGLLRAGSIAYSTANLESGWIPGPVPAIFTDDRLKTYREWLPAGNVGSLAGSLYSQDVADYYVNPWDLNYGRHIKFDHDFLGSDALRARADQPHRSKVTLVWEPEDISRIVCSQWTPGPQYKHFGFPKARYGYYQADEVLADGKRVGTSMDCGYIANGRSVVSLALVDGAVAEPGTKVSLVWGESPVSAKPGVEPHVQTEIRATVAPAPFDDFAHDSYRSNRR
jgi:vanillate/3-O-methylgallate O-demethylase